MAFLKNSKKLAIFAAAAALAVSSLTGCGTGLGALNAFQADTYTIEKQALTNSISVSGTVKGTELVEISSTVTSRISKLNVELGDYVKKGDVLCTFDKATLQEEYDSLKKSMDLDQQLALNTHEINLRNLNNAKKDKETSAAQAQRGINEAQATRDKAYSKYDDLCNKYNEAVWQRDSLYEDYMNYDGDDFNELKDLYESAASNVNMIQQERDTLYDQLSSYDSAVQNAKDAYNQAIKSADALIQSYQDVLDAEKYSKGSSTATQLDKLQEQLDNCVIKAPMDGIISAINVAEGNIPTTASIMTIEDDSSLKISTTVREADILKIKTGMKAVIKTNATKDQEFEGEVTKVVNIYAVNSSNPYKESEGGYTVEITVKDSENLFIGMNAKVKIILDEKENVYAVPYDAIVETDNGDSVVYVAKEQSDGKYKAEPVKVTPEMETDYLVEISSDKIKDGDLVVISAEYMNEDKEFNVRTGGLDFDE